MRRDGCDENNLQPTDFLCDYCGSTWSDDRPMVEGHRGSLVCARCLSLSFDLLWNKAPRWDGKSPPPPTPPDQTMPPGALCRMCLEHRDEPCWQSPMDVGEENAESDKGKTSQTERGLGVIDGGAWLCKRCAKQSVVMLERDPELKYERPK